MISKKVLSTEERKKWDDYIYSSSYAFEIEDRLTEYVTFMYDHPMKVSLSIGVSKTKEANEVDKPIKGIVGQTYISWCGSITIEVKDNVDVKGFVSSSIDPYLRIGTGGGGANGAYSYSLTLWCDDFPEIGKREVYMRRYEEIKKEFESKISDLYHDEIRKNEEFTSIRNAKLEIGNYIKRLDECRDYLGRQLHEIGEEIRGELENAHAHELEEKLNNMRESIYGK